MVASTSGTLSRLPINDGPVSNVWVRKHVVLSVWMSRFERGPVASAGNRFSSIQMLRRDNLDPEAGKPHVGELRRGEQPDRGNAEIFQDLGAQPHLAPLARARHLRAGGRRLRDRVGRHAGSAIAQEYQHATTLL